MSSGIAKGCAFSSACWSHGCRTRPLRAELSRTLSEAERSRCACDGVARVPAPGLTFSKRASSYCTERAETALSARAVPPSMPANLASLFKPQRHEFAGVSNVAPHQLAGGLAVALL